MHHNRQWRLDPAVVDPLSHSPLLCIVAQSEVEAPQQMRERQLYIVKGKSAQPSVLIVMHLSNAAIGLTADRGSSAGQLRMVEQRLFCRQRMRYRPSIVQV